MANTPINEIQQIGSHNSYRLMPPNSVLEEIEALRHGLREKIEYQHSDLDEQLDIGLRLLEIDFYADPHGGRYASPPNLSLLSETDPRPFQPEEMATAGFKVIHMQGYDNYSNCLTLRACLETLDVWSRANPRHRLIIVTLNVKEDKPFPNTDDPVEFDASLLKQLDKLLLEVLGHNRLLIPDNVRKDAASLREAVRTTGWPTLAETAGKFMFVLDEGEPSAALIYRKNHPSLTGRVMFAVFPETELEASFINAWNWHGREEDIRRLVGEGYLVRIAADIGTAQARANDDTRLKMAIRSGAQLIVSDFYPGHQSPIKTDYVAVFENGSLFRCGDPVARTP